MIQQSIHQVRQQVNVASRNSTKIIKNENVRTHNGPGIDEFSFLDFANWVIKCCRKKKKALSQQLWLGGHQRDCQKQFLTCECSWLIFHLFDLKLTSLRHIVIQVNRLVIEVLPSRSFFVVVGSFCFVVCVFIFYFFGRGAQGPCGLTAPMCSRKIALMIKTWGKLWRTSGRWTNELKLIFKIKDYETGQRHSMVILLFTSSPN